MADKNVDKLDDLFHEKSMFVHMGGSWGKEREMDIIEGGGIWYKKADIHEVSVKIIDNTAILLNRIDLLAEVGGNEVTNPFDHSHVGEVPVTGWDKVDAMLGDASKAFLDRKERLTVSRRMEILENAASIMLQRFDRLALLTGGGSH